MKAESLTKRWQIFVLERFPPLRHLFLIVFFFGANVFVALQTTSQIASFNPLCFIVVFIAFFRLRVFDEIKDYETDQKIKPHRPLARGLICLKEAKLVAFSIIIVELFLSSIIGMPALIATAAYICYSLLMYKEFFLGEWLRSKLATYALTHTIVSSLISFYIFSSVTNLNFWKAPISFVLFTIANWMIFNVFEFGRKTFGKEEEKEKIDSYSKNFGPKLAFVFVFFMAACAIVIALGLGVHFKWPFLILVSLTALFLHITTCGFLYSLSNSTKSALVFRGSCSLFILFYNLIISAGFLLC